MPVLACSSPTTRCAARSRRGTRGSLGWNRDWRRRRRPRSATTPAPVCTGSKPTARPRYRRSKRSPSPARTATMAASRSPSASPPRLSGSTGTGSSRWVTKAASLQARISGSGWATTTSRSPWWRSPASTTRSTPTSPSRRSFAPSGRVRPPGCPTADPVCRIDWPPVATTIGIVGLPNVGKSTLFNALTKNSVLAANYPFATIEPNVGVVGLPDKRLDRLAEMFGSAKVVHAPVTFVDIAGLVRGASKGQGRGNAFLANIREATAICQVVRVFSDPNVVHVEGKISPRDDIETINTELILADIQTLDKALPRLEKEAKSHKERAGTYAAAKAARELLDGGTTLYAGAAAAGIDQAELAEVHLLTSKPFLYVFNVDEEELANEALLDE